MVSLGERVLDSLQKVIFMHRSSLRKGQLGDFHLFFFFFLTLVVLIAKSESCTVVKVEK